MGTSDKKPIYCKFPSVLASFHSLTKMRSRSLFWLKADTFLSTLNLISSGTCIFSTFSRRFSAVFCIGAISGFERSSVFGFGWVSVGIRNTGVRYYCLPDYYFACLSDCYNKIRDFPGVFLRRFFGCVWSGVWLSVGYMVRGELHSSLEPLRVRS